MSKNNSNLKLKRCGLNERGVATLEYAAIITLMVLGSLVAIAQTGVALNDRFQRAERQMDVTSPMGDGLQGEGEGS